MEAASFPLPARLVALAAHDSLAHPWVVQSLAAHAARGQSLGVLVGHNRLDVYALARLLREHHLDPRPLLARIHLSRAFTCHQLHRRIQTLGPAQARRWSALYVLGLLDTFYDEDVLRHEPVRLLREGLAHLQELAAGGLSVLITVSAPKEAGREDFLRIVERTADVYWKPAEHAPQLPARPQLHLPIG
jgi:hypothetical protein